MPKMRFKQMVSKILLATLLMGTCNTFLTSPLNKVDAAETKYLPEADTYVSSVPAERDVNYNIAPTANQLHLRTSGENNTQYPFFRFNLSQLPTNLDGATFKLRLFNNYVASAATVAINVYAVADDTWSETAMTWNTQPAYGSLITTFNLEQAPAAGGTVDIDITNYIKQQKALDGKASLVVVSTSASWRAFTNKERTWEAIKQPGLIYLRDAEAPIYQSAEISPDYKNISLKYDEAILDNSGGSLKSKVLLTTDGTTYNPLGANDSVTVTDNVYLKVNLQTGLVGENNRIKVLASTLKDSYNNIASTEVVTNLLIGQVSMLPPNYLTAVVGGTAKTIQLNFDKAIAWHSGNPKTGFQISDNGGNTYQALSLNDNVTIEGSSVSIQFSSTLIGNNFKVKVLGNTIKSLASNLPLATDVITTTLNVPAPLSALVTVKVAADTYVDAGGGVGTSDVSANSPYYKNFGNETLMYIREVSGANVIGAAKARSFMKFDIANLGTFNTGKLRVYLQYGTTQAGTALFYAVEDDSWTETGMTYANQPAYGELLGTAEISANRTDTWYEVDITDYLSKQKAKDGVASIMIMNDSTSTTGARSFKTKEGSAVGTIYPQLAIDYDSKAPAISGVAVTDNQKVEVTFNESIYNKVPDLKTAISTSSNGTDFTALAGGDTVSISDKKLTINFAQKITVSSLSIKVAAGTLADTFGNANGVAIETQPIVVDVAAPIFEPNVTLDASNKVITLRANEALISKVADAAALKAAVTISQSNQAFVPLAQGDTVAINGNSLVVTLATKLSGSDYKIKVAASTLKDGSGNSVAEFISSSFSEDVQPPKLAAVYTVNFNKTIKVAFDEPIMNNLADAVALKNAIQLSSDGGLTYQALGANDKVEIGIKQLNIILQQPVTGSNKKVKILASALKDTVGFTTAEVVGAFAAQSVAYPYAEPSQHYLDDALLHIRNIAFANMNNGQGSAPETENAKGFAVVAQAIAAGNNNSVLIDEYVDALKKILSVPAKMPNLQAGLDDRSQSPIVYAIALLWNDTRITSRLSVNEKETLITFMKAALIAEMYMLNDYDKDGNYIGHTTRRLAMNGDSNNGVTGNFGEPHLTSFFASAFALGLENIKPIIAAYDHKAFIAELKSKGLTTIAASFENTNNFSTAATDALKLTEKAARVEATLKSSKWSFMNVTLNEFLEDPLKIHAAQEAFNWPYLAEDGEFQGQLGMGFEFQSADQGGPRESPSYVVLGLEPAISNTVLLNHFGYLHTPISTDLANHIEKLQKVAANDLYAKLVNGYFGQSWIDTHTYTLANDVWSFLMELLFSTGNITATTFNDTFNYSSVGDMTAKGWVVDQAVSSVTHDNIIPFNKKTVTNSSVVGGHNYDENEKIFTLNGGASPVIAYNTAKKLANINYYAWMSTPAIGNGEAGILARVTDANNYYQISYTQDKLYIKKKVNGSFSIIAEKAFTLPTTRLGAIFYFNPWGWKDTVVEAKAHRLRAELTNGTINVYVNGKKELTAQDATFATGYVGMTATGASTKFDGLLASYTLPDKPVLNSVNVGNGSLGIDFTPVDGALKYKVKYGTTSGLYTNSITTGSTTPIIPNLVNDTTYYVVVSSVTAQGESEISNEKSGTPKAPDAVTPVITSLIADGSKVTVNFTTDPKNTSYKIKVGKSSGNYLGTTFDVTNSGYVVDLPPTSRPYYFTIVPYNANGAGTPSNESSVVLDTPFLYIAGVTASLDVDPKYIAMNTIDGDLDPESRWSAEKEQWIQYDLGELKEINAVSLAFSNGHVRRNYFDITVSSDGINWTTVYPSGVTSGTTQGLETYKFNAVTAKYVRILCHGHSVAGYGLGFNSIIETQIFAAAPSKPTGLQVSSKTANSVSLTWHASTNQSAAVITYDVYQNGTKVNTSDITNAAYTISGLHPHRDYVFTVVAKDSNGKVSPTSNPLSVTTEAGAMSGTVTLTGVSMVEPTIPLSLFYGLAGAQNITAQDITITYDKTLFRFEAATAVQSGTTIESLESLPEQGKVRFIVLHSGAHNAITGDVPEILKITLSPLASGNGSIAVTAIELSNAQGDILGAQLASKSITVGSDKTALIATIQSAQAVYDAAVEGLENGQYPAGTKEQLVTAIHAATVVRDEVSSTSQVAAAITSLNDALSTFQSLVITSHTGDFNDILGYDLGDLGKVAPAFGKHVGLSDWNQVKRMDINNDGIIDIYEITFVVEKYIHK
ncbi:DUF7594 domain-containing protein [Paenibacillus qinlingensis]|uniref:CBM96 family carbohydrate-binding protein n=1 Tax=Paenibacillus qinlingensis TaxID=1837343 RepID=UPI001563E4C3|nr:DNRLRE domain-containing protein [Paenibacillus qinlingensis]NQX62686.1 DNRLRE domain-containing protein [Paenibacillus qinlingensis]